MIVLDTTTRKIEVLLGGTVTTNQLPIVTTYLDYVAGSSFTPGANQTQTNNATPVTIVSSPTGTTLRSVKFISIQNADTASQTVTVRYNDNGTTRNIVVFVLSVNDQLIYEDGQGWSTLNSVGSYKTTNTPASGSITSGMIGNQAVVSGSVAPNSFDNSQMVSGFIYGFVYGLNLNYVAAQQITVNSGYALDKSGIQLINPTSKTNVFISGTNNGAGNLDASPVGSQAQFASGFLVSGFWMSSGFLWPMRSGTGTMYVSGTNVVGFSGTDFLNQISVNDMVGVHKSGYWRVSAVNSGLITLSVSGGLVSGSAINILENTHIGMSGKTAVPVNAISSDTVMLTASGLWSGGVSGLVYIGGQPGTQVPMHAFVGQGASGTTCFLSTQRTTPLISGMVGYT